MRLAWTRPASRRFAPETSVAYAAAARRAQTPQSPRADKRGARAASMAGASRLKVPADHARAGLIGRGRNPRRNSGRRFEARLDTAGAERALEGADHRVGRVRRQILVARLAIGSEFERHAAPPRLGVGSGEHRQTAARRARTVAGAGLVRSPHCVRPTLRAGCAAGGAVSGENLRACVRVARRRPAGDRACGDAWRRAAAEVTLVAPEFYAKLGRGPRRRVLPDPDRFRRRHAARPRRSASFAAGA